MDNQWQFCFNAGPDMFTETLYLIIRLRVFVEIIKTALADTNNVMITCCQFTQLIQIIGFLLRKAGIMRMCNYRTP